MKTYSLLFSLLFCVYGFSQTNFKTLKESSATAVKANKQILLIHVNSEESRLEIDKKISSIQDAFVIHYVNVSKNSTLTEEQLMLNTRLDRSYNAGKSYPSLVVLGKYGTKKGVSFSPNSGLTIDQFISSLKAH
ncbi:hypothetical protein RM697_03205 [Ichthyenterobacterium sp. W332]|uniref:DUF4174 domain-containing protein n=1 Tax=Microcosmobacter mediterraneus TaxID=3075607 RepID=A0ABU2YIC5_9FLAO|nr:hypothetical protein [Ichthyenterobacterium sp. W332]MDT0557636.1 hypothetical protein [Ichthyenterobacterium sp. W332]